MSSARAKWADIDEDDDYRVPVPIRFLFDEDVVVKMRRSGLPEDRVGLQLRKLLDGTDFGGLELNRSSELTSRDVARIKEHCYWYRNHYRSNY